MGTVNTSEESVSDSGAQEIEATMKVKFALAGEMISSSFGVNPMTLGRPKSPSGGSSSSPASSPTSKSPEEFDIHQFRASLDPRYKQGLDQHIDSLLDDNRMVDRRTIRELVAEINILNTRIESLQGFTNFVEDSFDRDDTAPPINASTANIFEAEVGRSLDETDDIERNFEMLRTKTPREAESIVGYYLAFFCGAVFMLFCVYFDNIRASLR